MFVLQKDSLHCDVLRTFWQNFRMVDRGPRESYFISYFLEKILSINSFNCSSSWHLPPSFPCSQQHIHQTLGQLCPPRNVCYQQKTFFSFSLPFLCPFHLHQISPCGCLHTLRSQSTCPGLHFL